MEKCLRCGVRSVTPALEYEGLGLCWNCGRDTSKDRRRLGDKWVLRPLSKEPVEKEEVLEKVEDGEIVVVPIDKYKFIPPHMRWCALNPALTIHKDDMTQKDRLAEKDYVENEGAPTRLASNLYRLLKGNTGSLEKFFDKISKQYADWEKKKEVENQAEDVRQVASLFEMVRVATNPKESEVTLARKEGRIPARRVNKK